MPDDASIAAIPPTLANTRPVALAIWWKLCAIQLLVSFAAGFLGYVIPYGQLQFWLLAMIGNVVSPAWTAYLFNHPYAVQLAIELSVGMIGAILLLLILNVLIARHIGRRYGAFRLILQRIR